MKFTRKPDPRIVEAVKWDGTHQSLTAMRGIGAMINLTTPPDEPLGAFTLKLKAGVNGAQGWVDVPLGHWVMKGGDADFYPVEDGYMTERFDAVPSEG